MNRQNTRIYFIWLTNNDIIRKFKLYLLRIGSNVLLDSIKYYTVTAWLVDFFFVPFCFTTKLSCRMFSDTLRFLLFGHALSRRERFNDDRKINISFQCKNRFARDTYVRMMDSGEESL